MEGGVSKTRDINAMLQNIAARMRSADAAERRSAGRLLVALCARYGRNPADYGVRIDYDALYGESPWWGYAKSRDEAAAACEATDPPTARLLRFEAVRYRAYVMGRTGRRWPDGDGGGCAPMIQGYEDVPHLDYCRSAVCPHRMERAA
jgi:hypothetical protein